MAKKVLKVGVIGCGSIAQHAHIPGYLAARDVQLVAACDPGEAQRKKARSMKRGLKTYTTHQEMLGKHKLDIVSVCTPNYLHCEHAIAAMQVGAHVILEKPAAVSLEQIDRIRQVQRKTGRLLVVGFTHRFYSGTRKIKELIEQGAIGRPYMIRVRFAHTGPYPGWAQGPWFYDPQQACGGAMLDMGIHAIDLCNWLIGPVSDVAAQIGTLRKDIAVDDNAVLALRFANGEAMGYIDVGWTSPAGFTGLEVMGDEGCLAMDYTSAVTLSSDRVSPDHNAMSDKKTRVVDPKPTTGGWVSEIVEIVEAIRAGHDLGIGIDAGGAALAVALAGYKAAQTGRRAKVNN